MWGTIKRKQDFDKASRKLEVDFKRLPTSEEVATELNISVSELMSWRHDFAASKHQSIEEATEAYGDFLFSGDQSVEDKILNGELRVFCEQIWYILTSNSFWCFNFTMLKNLMFMKLQKYCLFQLVEFRK